VVEIGYKIIEILFFIFIILTMETLTNDKYYYKFNNTTGCIVKCIKNNQTDDDSYVITIKNMIYFEFATPQYFLKVSKIFADESIKTIDTIYNFGDIIGITQGDIDNNISNLYINGYDGINDSALFNFRISVDTENVRLGWYITNYIRGHCTGIECNKIKYSKKKEYRLTCIKL